MAMRRKRLHPCVGAALALPLLGVWSLTGHAFVQAMRKHMQRGLRTRRLAEEDSKQEEDTTNVELFRQSLIQGWGAGEVGRSSDSADWAELVDPDAVQAGDMLLGHPARFFSERTSPAFTRIGLQGGIPADYPRRERLRYLPVLLLTEVNKEAGTAKGVWLTLRTGQLLGDFIDFFHSRPLLYGGPTPSESVTMIHPYPEVPGSKKLSDDIYLGGSFGGAQACWTAVLKGQIVTSVAQMLNT